MILLEFEQLPAQFPGLPADVFTVLQNLNQTTVPGEIVLNEQLRVSVNVFDHPGRMEADAVTEAHRKFIDLHLALESPERIRLIPVEKLRVTKPWDSDADAELYETPQEKIENEEEVLLVPGKILLIPAAVPHTTQMTEPGDDGRQSRRKAVVKIPVQHWGGQ